MNAKNEIVLEHVKEDRVYRLHMPSNAPLGEAYEAAGHFMDEIIRLINEHTEKRAKLEVAQDEVEENVE